MVPAAHDIKFINRNRWPLIFLLTEFLNPDNDMWIWNGGTLAVGRRVAVLQRVSAVRTATTKRTRNSVRSPNGEVTRKQRKIEFGVGTDAV
jgi:hypothetical protein